MTDQKLITVHYDEIAMKGGRRRSFARKLLRNIRQSSPALTDAPTQLLFDRILLGPLPEGDVAAVMQRLADVPGVSWFAEVRRWPRKVESLPLIAEQFPVQDGRRSFRVATRRSVKTFPLNSMDINRELGRMIQQRTGWTVRMDEPEVTVYTDVADQGILVYHNKQRGLGGLPVGVSGKLIGLMSGGIDSPVAAFKMICRGCQVVLVHFHNFSPDAPPVRRKVIELAEQLGRYQPVSRLYLVPFARVQADLVASVPPAMRMVAYRRAMLRLATHILRAERALGFVVGDSVGQVASQTLENLQATYPAAPCPVLTPLIGDSKKAITELARQIGTYETSIQPYEDCCQFLISRSPETRCSLAQLEACEQNLPLDSYWDEIRHETEVVEIRQPAGAAVSTRAV